MKFAAISLSVVVLGVNGKLNGAHPNYNPCVAEDSAFLEAAFCDHTLPIDERIADILSRMTLEEKINNLVTTVDPTPSIGLPAYNWWSEATSGVGGTDVEMTKFAYPM